jgi:hypothetical protein
MISLWNSKKFSGVKGAEKNTSENDKKLTNFYVEKIIQPIAIVTGLIIVLIVFGFLGLINFLLVKTKILKEDDYW